VRFDRPVDGRLWREEELEEEEEDVDRRWRMEIGIERFASATSVDEEWDLRWIDGGGESTTLSSRGSSCFSVL